MFSETMSNEQVVRLKVLEELLRGGALSNSSIITIILNVETLTQYVFDGIPKE